MENFMKTLVLMGMCALFSIQSNAETRAQFDLRVASEMANLLQEKLVTNAITSNVNDMCRFTGIGLSPAQTGGAINYQLVFDCLIKSGDGNLGTQACTVNVTPGEGQNGALYVDPNFYCPKPK